jgi:hypothetical protein
MGISVFPAPSAASKTMYRETLTSGSSWTVPAGVTYVNVRLFGGGGGGAGAGATITGSWGLPGQVIASYLTTTPGASISYGIGAGGNAGAILGNNAGAAGGTTTFTGATSAVGGDGGGAAGGTFPTGTTGATQYNGGQGASTSSTTGGNGGAGKIEIEYWV